MQNNLKIIVIKVHLSTLTSITLIGTVIVNIVTQLLCDISKKISIVKLGKKIKQQTSLYLCYSGNQLLNIGAKMRTRIGVV